MDKITKVMWSELPDIPLECLSPRVSFASYFEWGQPYASGAWETATLSFLLMMEGRADYRAWDTQGRMLCGEMIAGEILAFFTGCMQFQTLTDRAAMYQCAVVAADGTPLRGVPTLPGVGRLPHHVSVGDDLPRLASAFLRIVRALHLLPVGWQLDTTAAMLEIMRSSFLAGNPAPPPQQLGPWERLLARMDAAQTPLHVCELAEQMGYSVNHFTRLFRQRTGTTPKQYQLARRLAHARGLLATGLSVQQAAQRCGFDDPLHFSRMFKQQFGVPPSRISELPQLSGVPDSGLPLNRHLTAPGETINLRYFGMGQPFPVR